jgi:hypothetical protein
MDAVANRMRNMIYILAVGLAPTDTFRLEVKITYEYIPTTSFKLWSSTLGPRASLPD